MTINNNYGTLAISETANTPLETWPNPEQEKPYTIHIEHPEYTALCPRSGYPDFGTIVLDYIPNSLIVELKAWKLYINSFRDCAISHEKVVNDIADRFYRDVQPRSMRIIGDFGRRGNVKTVITAMRGESVTFADYQANLL